MENNKCTVHLIITITHVCLRILQEHFQEAKILKIFDSNGSLRTFQYWVCKGIITLTIFNTVNPFTPRQFINTYLLLKISIQNRLFCYENLGIDHTLQAIQYQKQNSPKLIKRKVWIHFRRT